MCPRPALPLRFEYIILGLIRRQPAHGYELLQDWNQPNHIGMIWQVKSGLLYAALDKLNQLGFLEASLVSGQAAPLKKKYHITPAGEQVFLEWLGTPVAAVRDFRQDFLSRLFFAPDVDPGFMADLISRQKSICQGWVNSLESQCKNSAGFEQQVLVFRIHQARSILEWLEEPYSIDHHTKEK